MKIDVKRFAAFLWRLFSKGKENPDDIRRDIENTISILNAAEPNLPDPLKATCAQCRKRLRWIVDALSLASVLREV